MHARIRRRRSRHGKWCAIDALAGVSCQLRGAQRKTQGRSTTHAAPHPFRNEQESQDLTAQPVPALHRQPTAYTELMHIANRSSASEEDASRFDSQIKRMLRKARAPLSRNKLCHKVFEPLIVIMSCSPLYIPYNAAPQYDSAPSKYR